MIGDSQVGLAPSLDGLYLERKILKIKKGRNKISILRKTFNY